MCVCILKEVCFDCVVVLCFVMGYVLQFGETAHKRAHDYYYYYYYYLPALQVGNMFVAEERQIELVR